MKIIYIPHITRKYVRDRPNLLFIFGDNDERRGFGGLAKEVRGESNLVGIRVKRFPSYCDTSFYMDMDFFNQSLKIKCDVEEVKTRSKNYDAIVFPSNGIGTGLVDLKKISHQRLGNI
jgi:hypothetical protein